MLFRWSLFQGPGQIVEKVNSGESRSNGLRFWEALMLLKSHRSSHTILACVSVVSFSGREHGFYWFRSCVSALSKPFLHKARYLSDADRRLASTPSPAPP
jgi:hypothetical protein